MQQGALRMNEYGEKKIQTDLISSASFRKASSSSSLSSVVGKVVEFEACSELEVLILELDCGVDGALFPS